MNVARNVARYTGTCMALGLLLGCAQAPPPHDEPAARVKTQRIYGGEVSTEETDAVVHLEAGPDRDRYCSGTLVAPRLVLTARHCIAPYVEGDYQCSVDGDFSSALPRNPRDAGAVGLAYAPELVNVRYGQFPWDKEPVRAEKIYTVQTDTICRNDIAMVRLEQELPVPLRPMRLTEPTFPGEFVTVVGYGNTFTDVPGRHERHDVEILAVGESPIYPQGRDAYDRTIRLGQAACPGDSGGPILAETGAVLGVFSIIVNECNTAAAQNYYTQLAPYRTFIEAAFEDSGFEPLYESDSTSSDSTGSGGSAGEASDSGGSSAGGSMAAGGSGGEATTGVYVIPGRRKKDDGCSVGIAGDESPEGRWAPLLLGLGLLAFWRRSPAKPRRGQASSSG